MDANKVRRLVTNVPSISKRVQLEGLNVSLIVILTWFCRHTKGINWECFCLAWLPLLWSTQQTKTEVSSSWALAQDLPWKLNIKSSQTTPQTPSLLPREKIYQHSKTFDQLPFVKQLFKEKLSEIDWFVNNPYKDTVFLNKKNDFEKKALIELDCQVNNLIFWVVSSCYFL